VCVCVCIVQVSKTVVCVYVCVCIVQVSKMVVCVCMCVCVCVCVLCRLLCVRLHDFYLSKMGSLNARYKNSMEALSREMLSQVRM
jgi:hypothetical protein